MKKRTIMIGLAGLLGLSIFGASSLHLGTNIVIAEGERIDNLVSFEFSNLASIQSNGWSTTVTNFSADSNGRGISSFKTEGELSFKLPSSYGVSSIDVIASSNATGYTLFAKNGDKSYGSKSITKTNNSTYTFDSCDYQPLDTITLSWTKTSSSKSIMFKTITFKTFEVQSGNIESISISGAIKNKYTTKDNWSAEGLTANVTTSDGSEYDGKVVWSFEPATPAEMGIADNGELKVTASIGDISDTKTFTVSVTPGKGGKELPYSVEEFCNALDDGSVSESNAEYVEGYKIDASNDNYLNPIIADSFETDSKTVLLYKSSLDDSLKSVYSSVGKIPTGSKIIACGTPKIYKGTYETDSTAITSVVEPVLNSLNVELADAKKEFLQHYTVSKDDLKVTANYNNGFKKELTSDEFEFVSGQNLNNAGESTIVVRYGEITGSVLVDVKANELLGLTIECDMNGKKYYEGDEWDLSTLKFKLEYSGQDPVLLDTDLVVFAIQDENGNEVKKPLVGMTSVSIYAIYEAGDDMLEETLEVTGFTVEKVILEKLEWTNQQTEYAIGESFSLGQGAVKAIFNDSRKDKVLTTADIIAYLDDELIDETYMFTSDDNGKSLKISYSYGDFEVKTDSVTISIVDKGAVSKTIAEIASENKWSNATNYTSVDLDSNVTLEAIGGGYTGKYYSSNNSWRLYPSEEAKLVILLKNGYELSSVKLIASGNFTLKAGEKDISLNTENEINGARVEITITGSGNLQLTSIEVKYKAFDLADKINSWIEAYMHMNDEAYNGFGTGLCSSDKTYLSAKEALANLEGSYPGAIEKLCQDESFASVKARYENWAIACNDSKPYEGKTIVSNANGILRSINNTGTIASVSLVCLFGISAGIGAILLRKRKHN